MRSFFGALEWRISFPENRCPLFRDMRKVPGAAFGSPLSIVLPRFLVIRSRRRAAPAAISAPGWRNQVGGQGPAVAVLSSVEISRLMAAIAKRDAAAFEQLFAATSAKLYGVVLRILRRHDLAAAVIEAAYLQIWQTASQYDAGLGSPIAWMVAIARRR